MKNLGEKALLLLIDSMTGTREEIGAMPSLDAPTLELLQKFDAAWALVPKSVDWSDQPALLDLQTRLIEVRDIALRLAEKADPEAEVEDIDLDALKMQIEVGFVPCLQNFLLAHVNQLLTELRDLWLDKCRSMETTFVDELTAWVGVDLEHDNSAQFRDKLVELKLEQLAQGEDSGVGLPKPEEFEQALKSVWLQADADLEKAQTTTDSIGGKLIKPVEEVNDRADDEVDRRLHALAHAVVNRLFPKIANLSGLASLPEELRQLRASMMVVIDEVTQSWREWRQPVEQQMRDVLSALREQGKDDLGSS